MHPLNCAKIKLSLIYLYMLIYLLSYIIIRPDKVQETNYFHTFTMSALFNKYLNWFTCFKMSLSVIKMGKVVFEWLRNAPFLKYLLSFIMYYCIVLFIELLKHKFLVLGILGKDHLVACERKDKETDIFYWIFHTTSKCSIACQNLWRGIEL